MSDMDEIGAGCLTLVVVVIVLFVTYWIFGDWRCLIVDCVIVKP